MFNYTPQKTFPRLWVPLRTALAARDIGYDLCLLGFGVHQKNYHAGPDSLKSLYYTKSHNNLQRQCQPRLGELTERNYGQEKVLKKTVNKLFPFLGSKVGKDHAVYSAQNWGKHGHLIFSLVHNLWSQDYYRFSYLLINLKYSGEKKTPQHSDQQNKKKYFQFVFFHGKRENTDKNTNYQSVQGH